MKNQKTMGNKGFSLVELIVVIAIMVVLVAVLAPVFTKYIEQSRRATDISNANAIAEAVLTDAADGTITGDVTSQVVSSGNPTAIKSNPVTKGDAVSAGQSFYYTYTKDTNLAEVYVVGDTSYNLADETSASAYKSK